MLYAFYPNGQGQKSFFVVAEDVPTAEKEIDFHIKMSLRNRTLTDYDVRGWSDGQYSFEIFEDGQVAENDNG